MSDGNDNGHSNGNGNGAVRNILVPIVTLILGGSGVGAVTKLSEDVSIRERLTRLETQVEGIDSKLDRFIDKAEKKGR